MANQEYNQKKDIVDITRELLALGKELASNDKERLAQNEDMSKTLDNIVKNKKNSSELSSIESDLEDQLLTAKTAGNKELVKEIGLLQKVIKAKKKENEAQENINAAYRELGGKLGLGGLISMVHDFQELADKSGGVMLQKLFLIGLAVTAIAGLFKAIAAQTDEIGNRFGAIGVNEFSNELGMAKARAQSLGFDFDQMAGSVSELSDNFGIAFGDAIDISKATMDTARAVGVTTDTAAKLTGILMTMGGHSAETAQNFIKQTAALAKSAGVAPAAVLNDMAGASGDIAGFIKDGGENMAQAAVRARKMGLAIGDVAKAARGMLDFQESISAELEASVMLGRQLNFQRARELALAGDLEGFQKEILKQVKSAGDFNKMNVLQREALAKAVGMEVDQLTKLVNEQGKSVKELARMRELSIDEIVSSDALSNITLLMNNIKAAGTAVLSFIANIGTLGGTLDGIAGSIVGTLVVGLALGATAFLFFAFKAKIAAAAMSIFGTSAAAAGPAVGSFGAAAAPAIPVMLIIMGIGLSLVGVFYAFGYILSTLPPIIMALAEGFKIVADAATDMILKLSSAETVAGIVGLSLGFYMLAGALAAVALAGTYAMLPLLGLLTFVGGLAALGFTADHLVKLVHGNDGPKKTKKKEDTVEYKLDVLNRRIDTLLTGFGITGETANGGQIVTDLANANAGIKIIPNLEIKKNNF